MTDNNIQPSISRRLLMKTVGTATIVSRFGGTTTAKNGSNDDQESINMAEVNVSLDKCETTHAPDPRVTYYNVNASENKNEQGVSLHGAVQSNHLQQKAVNAAKRAANPVAANNLLPNEAVGASSHSSIPVDTSNLKVFNESARELTIKTGVAPVRDSPNGDAGRLTEAVYGAQVIEFERRSGWSRVRVPDGYLGWIQSRNLTKSSKGTFTACLQKDVDTSINELETLYAGTDCIIEDEDDWKPGDGEPPWAGEKNKGKEKDEEVTVKFRTGTSLKLPRDKVAEPSSAPTREAVVENAMYYLELEEDVPYLWGGMTSEGIDCSGFVWMAYRMAGLTLPRDSDQQQKMGKRVSRNDLRPGDLLCFPGHIAISLGENEFINSRGGIGPTRDSFDPDGDDYFESIDEWFEEARRIL